MVMSLWTNNQSTSSLIVTFNVPKRKQRGKLNNAAQDMFEWDRKKAHPVIFSA